MTSTPTNPTQKDSPSISNRLGTISRRSKKRTLGGGGDGNLLSSVTMKHNQSPGDLFMDMEDDIEDSSSMAMDLDDAVGPLEMYGDGSSSSMMFSENHKLVDSDFFNSFEDDFDDSDIN